jgi:hypothetical protein
LLGVFSGLIGGLFILIGFKTGFKWPYFLVLGLCAYFPFGWIIERRLAVTRQYRRHPELYYENTVTFTNESLKLSSIHMDLRLNWDRLAMIVSTRRGLLFLTPPHEPLFWLPERLFEGNDFREKILEVATKHKVQIRPMS